jgi:hypothetical protein
MYLWTHDIQVNMVVEDSKPQQKKTYCGLDVLSSFDFLREMIVLNYTTHININTGNWKIKKGGSFHSFTC